MTEIASRIVAYLDDSTEPLITQHVPAAFTIDTHLLEDGDHVLRIEAWDQRGSKGVKRIPFSVRNGPSITLRGLEPNNVVEGHLALTVHAFAGAREEDWEPAHAETPAPVPTWVWVLLIGVMAWAMYYVVAFWTPNRFGLTASTSATSCSRLHRVEQESKPQCGVCGLVPLSPNLRGSTRIVTESAAMQGLLKLVARFARSDAPVAVLGETGTGKEVIARLLHANSARAGHPFIAVNVAALPADLLESELFGHGKGAYTGASSARRGLFEAANGGTLFLDEIGEMPPSLQAKLLRVLQDGEVRRIGENTAFAVDVRIVCATHRDIAERVRAGSFRQDLFYRLKVLTLHVPPLRERRDDILPLARQFLASEKRAAQGFSTDTEARLLSYSWPGNVRELQNAVKYAAAVAQEQQVHADDLPDELRSAAASRRPGSDGGPEALLTLAEVERQHILNVLDACGGSQTEAAGVLGVARNTLWRKVRRYT